MKLSKTVIVLSLLIAVLALFAAGVGLFRQDGGGMHSFTTPRGVTAQLYGQGLYGFDTFLIAAGSRGTDAVTLFFEIPLLVVAVLLYRRGSLKGGLLLLASLGYFLYYYTSMAIGVAYNELFLIYVILFSASLFAFVLAFSSVDVEDLPTHFSPRLPHRGIVVYLFAVGTLLIVVWVGLTLLPAMLAGKAPDGLAIYTTLTTHVLDLGVIMPTAFTAGVLYLRRRPLGYVLAPFMILLNVTLGTALLGQGAAQLLLRVPMGIGEIVGFMASFAILTLVSVWLMVILFRNLAEVPLAGR